MVSVFTGELLDSAISSAQRSGLRSDMVLVFTRGRLDPGYHQLSDHAAVWVPHGISLYWRTVRPGDILNSVISTLGPTWDQFLLVGQLDPGNHCLNAHGQHFGSHIASVFILVDG